MYFHLNKGWGRQCNSLFSLNIKAKLFEDYHGLMGRMSDKIIKKISHQIYEYRKSLKFGEKTINKI